MISCGLGNAYGHPTRRTLERLADLDCRIYRTDKQGTITAALEGGKMVFDPEPTKDLTPGSTVTAQGAGTAQSAEDARQVQTYVLNTNSFVFHLPSCLNAAKMSARNKVFVNALREDLIARGYRPCKNCRP